MTTDLKHTPGPWMVTDAPSGQICVTTEDEDGSWICGQIHNQEGEMSREEAVANAFLIAASPELLEALIEAEVRLRYSGDHFHDVGATDRAEADWAAADKARAAIAKAGA